ncbi:hypothetical protein ACI2VH_02760 [Ralstonia nicotianae]
MQMPTVNARCAAMIDEVWHPYWWINAIGAPVSVSAADVQCVMALLESTEAIERAMAH